MAEPGARHKRWYDRTLTSDGLTIAALLGGVVVLDALTRPRSLREWPGLWLLACMTMTLFGLFLAVSGNGIVAAALALAVQALLGLASNAKHAVLGEPLLFSDLALVGAIFRHPQFYLSAVAAWQRVMAGFVGAILLVVLAWLFVPDVAAHLEGSALVVGGLIVSATSLRLVQPHRLAPLPDAHADVRRLGLLPTLLLYWLRWRVSIDPPPCPAAARVDAPDAPALLVIIQCESFADPVDLFARAEYALPGLDHARANAWQWGNLQVSGFGAYTMRTEYGVLFGREEEDLGFRRYDPFLTALGESSYALPARMKAAGWSSLFVHPHDMRFYGRDRIMPAGGFAALVGEDQFAAPSPGEGRYVTDAAVAEQILQLAGEAVEANSTTMLYAVTIENHGPWAADGEPGSGGLIPEYLRLARNSDAMLTTLIERIGNLARDSGRPAMLVFFGDHRPSIPGVSVPGGDRHTPYVIVRMDAQGALAKGRNRRMDLTPAALHHVILRTVLGAADID